MACIGDLCWSLSEDLFEDLDLDELYCRQVQVFGAQSCATFPYRILVHTGRITVGIELGSAGRSVSWALWSLDESDAASGPAVQPNPLEEQSE